MFKMYEYKTHFKTNSSNQKLYSKKNKLYFIVFSQVNKDLNQQWFLTVFIIEKMLHCNDLFIKYWLSVFSLNGFKNCFIPSW